MSTVRSTILYAAVTLILALSASFASGSALAQAASASSSPSALQMHNNVYLHQSAVQNTYVPIVMGR
jgi:hypothetical protein